MLLSMLIIYGLKNGKEIKKVCWFNIFFFLIYNFKNQILSSEWFTCLWNNCTFQSSCEVKSTTHVNFHAYHTRLKCVGLAVLSLCEIPVCIFLQ